MKDINYIILVTQNVVLMCIPFLVVLISRLYKDQRVDKKVIELLEHSNHMQETKIKVLELDIEILETKIKELELDIKTLILYPHTENAMKVISDFHVKADERRKMYSK